VTRIYTRTGDDGTTGLVGGKRVAKDSPLIEACGELDELNALIGVARSHGLPETVDGILASVQRDLFAMGTEIATPDGIVLNGPRVRDETVRALETAIDTLGKTLEPLRNFILPGGADAAAELHLIRAVARRAERHCVAVSRLQQVSPQIIGYLNRLSDLCFILARYINRHQGVTELQVPRTGSLT
jgi:cob(I)alamin adenosyltransferase